MRLRAASRPFLAAAILAAAVARAGAATGEPAVRVRPPRIASVAGPAGTAWSGCAILLEGRTRGDVPPQVSTLCLVEGQPTFTVLGTVAARTRSIAAEAGPGGSLRILVGRPGGIDEMRLESPGAPAQIASLVEDDALEPTALADRPDLDGDGDADLLQATYEGLSLYRREDHGGMTRLQGVQIPPFAEVEGEQLTVHGRPVLEPVPSAPVRWTWPETLQGKRLRTYRVPLAAGGEVCAAWIDAESQVYASRAVALSGTPERLVALVAPADRFSLFGNLTLIVAPLACDATARGSRPTLALETEFNANIGWAALGVRDVTGDGLADITILGRQGLTNEKLRVAVHAGRADGSFSAKPATEVRSDLDPLFAVWDKDVDGDGRLDLVVLERTRVMLARGIQVSKETDVPFELRKPVFAALPASIAAERLALLLDFDGDGRLDALVAGDEPQDKEKGGVTVRVGNAVAPEKDARLAIVPLR